MILALTEENLIECGFTAESITKILTWDNCEPHTLISDKIYYAVQSEKKIYIGIEAERKAMMLNKGYFPIRHTDLFIEYYNLSLNHFLNNRKEVLGILYDEKTATTDFIKKQIELFEVKIKWQQDFIDKMKGRDHESRKQYILLYQTYIERILKKTLKKGENYKNEIWFKIGLELANGEAYRLRKENLSFRDIAKELGFKESDHTYFSQSIGSRSENQKNIYKHLDRLKKIHRHFTENNIDMCEEFLKECTSKHPNEF